MNKRKITVLAVTIGTILAALVGGTYAFILNANSNASSTPYSVSTGSVELIFNDKLSESGTITTQTIEPTNVNIVRHFNTNNAGGPAYVNILFKDLVNTYLDGSLVYTLKSGSVEGTYGTTILNIEKVPVSSIASDKELIRGLLVPTGYTYYELTVSYDYSPTVDQTADLNATFNTGFTIEPGSDPSNIYCVDASNNEIDCPSAFTMGDRIAIGRTTPQYFRYLRTTNTAQALSECGTTLSSACNDSVSDIHRFLAEYNLKAVGNQSDDIRETGTAISADALQDPNDYRSINGINYAASNNIYATSYLKTYMENYQNVLNTMIGEANSVSVNLLTKAEAMNLFGCPDVEQATCSTIPEWARYSTYWLGSAARNSNIWQIKHDGTWDIALYYYPGRGARPVVNISAALFNK